MPGDDNRLCGFLPPEPPSFPEVPWANRLIEPPLLKLQRLRSASCTGFTRGLMLGNAPPVQKFFCTSGCRCQPVRSDFACALAGDPLASRGQSIRLGGSMAGVFGPLWFTGFTRGLMLGNASPVQKFFCTSGCRCQPVRSDFACALAGDPLASRGQSR